MPTQDENKKAEQELAKVRKLPENKRCANCLEPGTPLLTAVCMPFRIFVCSTCKSAHGSFSQRCKSTQMSLWTMEEVRSLEERNGGGNKVAQETWLANVRRDDRPREGDSLDRFKAFVQEAYIDKRWLGSSSDRRNDDDRDDRGSRAEPRQRDRDEDRGERRSRREAAPAPLAPPKTKAGASSSSTSSASRGQHSSRSRAEHDDFNPNATPNGQRQSSGTDGFDPNVGGFDPNAGWGTNDFDPNAGAVAGALDLFNSNASAPQGQAVGGGFDPFAMGGSGPTQGMQGMPNGMSGLGMPNGMPVPGMQDSMGAPAAFGMPNGMPAPATQAAGGVDPFDPFAGGSGFISAQALAASPSAPVGNGVSGFQNMNPMPGVGAPGMSGGYAAAFGGQPPYQAGAQYQQMPGMRPNMPGSMGQGMGAMGGGGMRPAGMPGRVPGGGVGGNGMQGAAFPQAFPQGYQQAFGTPAPMQQGVQGFPQALQQHPQQPQPQPQQQAPRLEDRFATATSTKSRASYSSTLGRSASTRSSASNTGKEPLTLHATNPWAQVLGAKLIHMEKTNPWANAVISGFARGEALRNR